MTETGSVHAYGTLLKRGGVAIAEVLSIDGPEFSTDMKDVTHLNSPGGYEEVIGTVKRTGMVACELNFLPADPTHDASTGLISDWQNKVIGAYEIVFPDDDSTTWSFSGLVVKFKAGARVDDRLTASVSIKVTGEPTLA